jgi:hypothetical protein
MEALQKVQPTLRELDISLDLDSEFSEEVEQLEIWPFPGQLGSLREFSRLRKLRAPIVMLLGWSPDKLPLRLAEVMPAGLTHLGLTEDMATQCTYEWDEELILGELEVFLSVWRSVTPDLRVVEVWLSRDFSRWKVEEVVQLRTMCEGAGVSCNVHWPMSFQWVRQGPQPKPRPLPATPPAIEHIHHNNKTANLPEDPIAEWLDFKSVRVDQGHSGNLAATME